MNIFSSLALLYCLYQYSEGKQCVRIQDSPLASCAVAGYNYTYPLPDGLSQHTVDYIKWYLSFVTKQAANCSVVQIAEVISCMNFAPRCLNANEEPVLPCRRVCSELFKRCANSLGIVQDWMLLQCLVLPNDTAASGKCYEPKGFDQHFNATPGPLERGCQKLLYFPFCEGLGYNYTVDAPDRQLLFYKILYGKKFSQDENRTTPATGSTMEKVMLKMKSAPKCAASIHKLICGWIASPCFPDEGPAYYTVCQSVCKTIGEQCPEVVQGVGRAWYGQCERMAPGITSHGFCKHTKLPPIVDWFDYLKDKPKPSSKGLSTTAIVIISIVIPLVVIIIIIIAVVFMYKKRKLASMFAYQRHN